MKCKNCGGELHFENGVARCDSCGNQYKIDHFFEQIDVYICYIESDATGRRTRDSMIAQEIYQKLELKKIKTFYERISAADSVGDDLEQLRYSSLCIAKVILVVGTAVESFRAISEKYSKHFTGKTIVPVFADVNPSDIPAELGRYQALNYAAIGWEKDLERGLLRILGRENELESEDSQSKGKSVLIGVIVAAVLLVIGLFIFLYRPQNTPEAPTVPETTAAVETTAPPPLTNQQIYDEAKALTESGSYMEALEAYQSIPAYKDSQNQIISLYNRFDGYYQDEQQIYAFYLNIVDGKYAEITFDKTEGRKVVRIEETLTMESGQIKGVYVDSFENEGEISVELQNDQITVTVSTTGESGKMSVGNITVPFLTANRLDRPPIKEVTREDLLYWVSNPTSPEEIKAAGFELEYINTNYDYSESFGTQYKIVNTDILIVTTNIDFENFADEYNYATVDNFYVAAIIAPASLICPDKIGNSTNVFTDNGVAYAPNATDIRGPGTSYFVRSYLSFIATNSHSEFSDKMNTLIIAEDTTVGIASENIVGSYFYEKLIECHQDCYNRSLSRHN